MVLEVADICKFLSHNLIIGPDSVMVRAFASEAGGAGSNPGRVIPKTLKMVPVATLLGAQHYKASTGFSSLKKITSMMGAPCNTLFMRCLEYLADSDSDQFI